VTLVATAHLRLSRKPVRRSGGSAIGVKVVEVSPVTIKHQTWRADALAGSVLMFALYFILVEFSKARLP
jgi:hypothetical protein